MIFIGAGALLYRSVRFAQKCNYSVDSVLCFDGDGIAKRLSSDGLAVQVSKDPQAHLPQSILTCSDRIVFSINNPRIICDEVLSLDAQFFNLHNGLVQRYRGIAEICIIAAILNGETEYGATLHALRSGEEVDSGPVVDQLVFSVASSETFDSLIEKSLVNCQALFENSLCKIVEGDFHMKYEAVHGSKFTYSSLRTIFSACSVEDRIERAKELGRFSGFFPRLQSFYRDLGNFSSN